MPTYDAGTTGLTGTIGVTILDSTGAVHVARATAGITEPVAGSGVYYIADHDASATLTYVWDNGVGTVGASETLYAGRTTVGAGATEWTYTLTTPEAVPIADADVWATTDVSGANVVASGTTDNFGVVTFWLDAGTYYIWRQKSGWTFVNPDIEVVS